MIWHDLFSGKTPVCQTCLVEPRDKRAWFLHRISGLFSELGAPPFSVHEGRWGDRPAYFPVLTPAPLVIISLKALHLTDMEVLAGLTLAVPDLSPGRVVIARFYPADQPLDTELVEKLGIPAPGKVFEGGPGSLVAEESRILSWSAPGPKEASLVLSLYGSP